MRNTHSPPARAIGAGARRGQPSLCGSDKLVGMTAPVERARTAFARQEWRDAFRAFAETAEAESLDPADYERLAVSAYLVGEDDECVEAWEAAHRAALDAGDGAGAARCAFWLGLCLMLRAQVAQASGWFARAERLIEDARLDCAAAGYLLIPGALGALEGGDAGAARDLAVRATELANRFDDPDLRAFGTLGHGQALIAMGDTAGGTARLDEVMVSVTAGEVGPVTSGIVYCAVILECMDLFDMQRASEWTDALSAWCDAQPDLVPYRGQCMVHRSQLQQAAGDWADAITSIEEACQRLTDPPHPALGLAYYQEAELHRLVGAFDDAEASYRLASRHGRDPMPGLALLELARGDVDAAATSIQRALHEARSPQQRPALLFAAVDILRATGDLPGARSAADELAGIAAGSSSEVLDALSAQSKGTVLTGEGDPATALPELRAAAMAWQSLQMPYEAARTAVLFGLACSALGDRTTAALEFGNARETFTELGAVPDLERLATLSKGLVEGAIPRAGATAATLSPREREVLAQVVAGRTNRQIAEALVISQHTVARHLEHIFAKLGVTSRAAATAYAYEHDLL
jgi:DNA-binding CsgD family transcriptional regulator/tetratricopeptide (TPR) repeat protein